MDLGKMIVKKIMKRDKSYKVKSLKRMKFLEDTDGHDHQP